jgi:hypothetical protein
MAAKKSAKKKDATKTPRKASKKSKVENRRPAPTIGDTAGAEFNPARTPEGERVAATGANPAASRAGLIVEFATPASESRPKGELGLSDLSISVIDGSAARLKLGNTETGNLSQADLITIRKQLDAAVQGTV